jgi:hypothetical protein
MYWKNFGGPPLSDCRRREALAPRFRALTGSADAACSKRPEQASTRMRKATRETLGVVGKLTSAAHPTEIDVLGPVPAESTPTEIRPPPTWQEWSASTRR